MSEVGEPHELSPPRPRETFNPLNALEKIPATRVSPFEGQGFSHMMLIPTYVAPSPIEGVGVFAAEYIEEGALIWNLDPGLDRLIRKDEVAGLRRSSSPSSSATAIPIRMSPAC